MGRPTPIAVNPKKPLELLSGVQRTKDAREQLRIGGIGFERHQILIKLIGVLVALHQELFDTLIGATTAMFGLLAKSWFSVNDCGLRSHLFVLCRSDVRRFAGD